MKMLISWFLALAITLICLDFAVRTVRFALTGRGKGDDFRLIWWKDGKNNER